MKNKLQSRTTPKQAVVFAIFGLMALSFLTFVCDKDRPVSKKAKADYVAQFK